VSDSLYAVLDAAVDAHREAIAALSREATEYEKRVLDALQTQFLNVVRVARMLAGDGFACVVDESAGPEETA
jgi:hypothetical protein